MNLYISLGFIVSFLLISVAGVATAEETTGYRTFVQGGETVITDGQDGGMLITVHDVVPYFVTVNENKNLLLPVRQLSLYTYPLNAAVVLSTADGDSASLVQVSNVSLSDENTVLTLQIDPLAFYEGEMLTAFAGDAVAIENASKNSESIGIYFEGTKPAPENTDCPPGCGWNGFYCGDFRGWICCPSGPCTAIGNDCVCN